MRIIANAGMGAVGVPTPLDDYMSPIPEKNTGSGQGQATIASARQGDVDDGQAQPPASAEEIFSLVRHGKVKKLKEALQVLPSRRFDPSLVKASCSSNVATKIGAGAVRRGLWHCLHRLL